MKNFKFIGWTTKWMLLPKETYPNCYTFNDFFKVKCCPFRMSNIILEKPNGLLGKFKENKPFYGKPFLTPILK